MHPLRTLQAALLLLLAASCTSWRPAEEYEGWTLYVQSGESVSIEEFHGAVQPAFEAVEGLLGPFSDPVRVHAWDGGVQMDAGNHGHITSDADEAIEEVPGIGPARVRAFHTRGSGGLFDLSGVFVGTADTGTAVHELVHAHLAEAGERLPLWFEEGFAMILGDGTMREGRWIVDGLACWPWRELRLADLSEEEVAKLLTLRSGEPHSVRDNVLVHFLGWAVVFDLYRELGVLDWRRLLERFQAASDPVAEARRRLRRTLDEATPVGWLEERLESEDVAVRLAAARGTWKLHSLEVLWLTLAAIPGETDIEVRASLAVNALAAAGQVEHGRRTQRRLWRTLLPVLREAELPGPGETSALRTLYRAYRFGSERYDTQAALERLERFWEE